MGHGGRLVNQHARILLRRSKFESPLKFYSLKSAKKYLKIMKKRLGMVLLTMIIFALLSISCVGGRHRSVDSTAPIILRSWVWIPSKPTTLIPFNVKFMHCFGKRMNINKEGTRFYKKISYVWESRYMKHLRDSFEGIFTKIFLLKFNMSKCLNSKLPNFT